MYLAVNSVLLSHKSSTYSNYLLTMW